MMQVTIKVDGVEYVAKPLKGDITEGALILGRDLDSGKSGIIIELEDGRTLVLGPDVTARAHFFVGEEEPILEESQQRDKIKDHPCKFFDKDTFGVCTCLCGIRKSICGYRGENAQPEDAHDCFCFQACDSRHPCKYWKRSSTGLHCTHSSLLTNCPHTDKPQKAEGSCSFFEPLS